MATVTTTATTNGSVTLTYAITCPAGTDVLMMIVTSQSSPSATYNGVSMSLTEQGVANFFGDNFASIFRLASPSTGAAYNVVVSGVGATASSSAFAVANVDPSIIDATKTTYAGGSGTGSTDTTLTTNFDNSIIFTCCVQHSTSTANPAMAVKYGATSTYDDNPTPNFKYGGSYQLAGVAGSQNVGWDDVAGRDLGGVHSVLTTVAIRSRVPTTSSGFFMGMIRNKRF
jgi:hypothetical protein